MTRGRSSRPDDDRRAGGPGSNRLALAHPSPHLHLAGSEPTWTGASGPRLQGAVPPPPPGTVQPFPQPQESPPASDSRKQPVPNPPSRPYHLARHLDPRHAERAELHPQQRPLPPSGPT